MPPFLHRQGISTAYSATNPLPSPSFDEAFILNRGLEHSWCGYWRHRDKSPGQISTRMRLVSFGLAISDVLCDQLKIVARPRPRTHI